MRSFGWRVTAPACASSSPRMSLRSVDCGAAGRGVAHWCMGDRQAAAVTHLSDAVWPADGDARLEADTKVDAAQQRRLRRVVAERHVLDLQTVRQATVGAEGRGGFSSRARLDDDAREWPGVWELERPARVLDEVAQHLHALHGLDAGLQTRRGGGGVTQASSCFFPSAIFEPGRAPRGSRCTGSGR